MSLKLGVSGSGYLYVRDGHDSENQRVYVHRLAALADHSLDELRGCDVHHMTGVPELNARDKLVPIPSAEHRAGNF